MKQLYAAGKYEQYSVALRVISSHDERQPAHVYGPASYVHEQTNIQINGCMLQKPAHYQRRHVPAITGKLVVGASGLPLPGSPGLIEFRELISAFGLTWFNLWRAAWRRWNCFCLSRSLAVRVVRHKREGSSSIGRPCDLDDLEAGKGTGLSESGQA